MAGILIVSEKKLGNLLPVPDIIQFECNPVVNEDGNEEQNNAENDIGPRDASSLLIHPMTIVRLSLSKSSTGQAAGETWTALI